MKRIILGFCFTFLVLVSFAQTDLASGDLLMTKGQNQDWLTSIKSKNKDTQWSMISKRFFGISDEKKKETEGKCCYPVLIIDGIEISLSDTLSSDIKTRPANLLTNDKIKEIAVLDKEPEGLYIEKAFTGLVVVTLNDKRTSKKLSKMKIK